uniref:p43 n=1 Tax=Eisenia andrei TaxID=168636 RepID=I3NNU8_9ANNE|nr:P43 [Eisenia andrei]
MTSQAVLQKLQSRASLADRLLRELRTQLEFVRKSAVEKACLAEEERLSRENQVLRRQVETLKQRLIKAEIENGVKQVPLPGAKPSLAPSVVTSAPPALKVDSKPEPLKVNGMAAATVEKKEVVPKKDSKKEAKTEKKADAKPAGAAAAESGDKVDVSRLNMRIGKIVNVKKHPDADSLYVEEVDVGEPKTRTIVSGLVQHVPLEQMQDRIGVFLSNLKPAKMRGILSEGMIMCGSSPEKVEIIDPPIGAAIGDRVVVDGYSGGPDEQLNPKKEIWEQIQPDLRINDAGVATYKGIPWNVRNLGPFKVATMTNSGIK